ncbi:cob(I)yrinic acid a,c-diamide adenosyltransferase [Clostridium sardiniense]|uniref:cob(I)yrinic acid a,c-diamide adenosyltransferase n=1 Tax=Clostridium sardiniense TaxID=29369 RepID=UPI003D348D6D
MKLNEGFVQIYTGNGKGKTTAAIGQGMRAYGNGLKVIMVQFLKSGRTGELNTVDELGENFEIFRFEKRRGFVWTLTEEEKEEVKKEVKVAYNFIIDILENCKCDMLIIDEVMGVLKNEFLSVEEVIELIDKKPKNVELIMTGRNVPKEIVDRANLVTEMKEIKHYYKEGVPARKGVEF